MNDDQFTKLFRYMSQEFDDLRNRLDTKADKADLERIYGLLDSVVKQQEVDDHKRLALGNQLGRHERWIVKAGTKLAIPFKHD